MKTEKEIVDFLHTTTKDFVVLEANGKKIIALREIVWRRVKKYWEWRFPKPSFKVLVEGIKVSDTEPFYDWRFFDYSEKMLHEIERLSKSTLCLVTKRITDAIDYIFVSLSASQSDILVFHTGNQKDSLVCVRGTLWYRIEPHVNIRAYNAFDLQPNADGTATPRLSYLSFLNNNWFFFYEKDLNVILEAQKRLKSKFYLYKEEF